MTPVEHLLRDEWGRLLALLVASTRRLDLAEDALASAFEEATRRWPIDGTPSNPSAWLLTASRRLVVDAIRAEATHEKKQPLMARRTPRDRRTSMRWLCARTRRNGANWSGASSAWTAERLRREPTPGVVG